MPARLDYFANPVTREAVVKHLAAASHVVDAWAAKDISARLDLLDPEATATGDGGGLVGAALQPIHGAKQIAEFFAERADAVRDLTILERTVNGQPGLVTQRDGVTVTVIAFDVAGDRIKHIWAVLNPDKLRSWRPPDPACSA